VRVFLDFQRIAPLPVSGSERLAVNNLLGHELINGIPKRREQ
jgi:hypothetical protein